MGEKSKAYRILMGKPEEKRPLERPRCKREDNIKRDLTEIGWAGRTGLIWLRIVTNVGPSSKC
jgi:hypothetical protein